MDEFFAIWDPPGDLIPKAELPGSPGHGIGPALFTILPLRTTDIGCLVGIPMPALS